MTSLGVDPKNDYAFKCVFGSELHTRVLVHLLNAVLDPAPGQRIARVEILNPITEPVVLDDKLSILDIRAGDQSGRQFNIEMQMVPHVGLRGRWLYYWSKLYGGQLQSGDKYELLQPAISICFVDGLMFAETPAYHLKFCVWDAATGLTFSDHLAIHVFQLPRFTKPAVELTSPLDLWLFFLNNGEWLDPGDLPEALRVAELEEAVDVMQRLTQEQRERARYEARARARHDALDREAREADLQRATAEVERRKSEVERQQSEVERQQSEVERQQSEVERQQSEVERQQSEVERQQSEVERQQSEVERQQAEVERQQAEIVERETGVDQRESEFRAQATLSLIRQIRGYERLLQRSPLSDDRLQAMSIDELLELVNQLQSQLPS